MKLKSRRFGEMEIEEEKILFFPDGLIGFPDCTRFVIHQFEEEAALGWLQSVDEPDLAFVLVDPTAFIANYKVELGTQDVEKLGLTDKTESCVFVIAVVPESIEEMTVNLMAPIVINVDDKKGRQVVLDNSQYSVRHKVFESAQSENKKEDKRIQAAL